MFYVVDRIEGDIAVLVGDDNKSFDVPRRQLPKGTREGSVFRLTKTIKGQPDWTMAELDEVERKRRLKEMKETVERLRKKDPGGDVSIS
jgi:hypothetical protein